MKPAHLSSFASAHQSGACTGVWKLPAKQVVSLRPREAAVLRIQRGRLWVTLGESHGAAPGDSGDHVLEAGQELCVSALRQVVLEAWQGDDVCFDWVPVLQAEAAAAGWREAVLQPARDLREAAGLAVGALVRLGAGLGRLAWGRLALRQRAAGRTPNVDATVTGATGCCA